VKDNIVKSFEDLHGFVQSYTGQAAVYRGVNSTKYLLMPKVGRIED